MSSSNQRGPIAESYEQLQALELLGAARDAHPLPKAGTASALRAILQSAEIALLNLADLFARAGTDVSAGGIGRAVVKLSWAHGFHGILTRLGVLTHHLRAVGEPALDTVVLSISESPALAEYRAELRRFDQAVVACADAGNLNLEQVLEEQSLDSLELKLLHLARVCNHETVGWESDLAEVRVPAPTASYEEFTAASLIRDAVHHTELAGDTFFTQFVGLHQIPETLATEVNDQIESAILAIQSQRWPDALRYLSCANVLVEGILAAIPPLADNLVASDFYEFRENLGQTSGSHSVALRYHLFRDLYEQLWESVVRQVMGHPAKASSPQIVEDAIRQLDCAQGESVRAWQLRLILNECLRLRTSVAQWRQQHLHLPRNSLGSNTRSLTGSSNAVKVVMEMRNSAQANDPMRPLARARGVPTQGARPAAPLADYLRSASSLDSRIQAIAGENTQRRFPDVEERSGGFAASCPFSAPPRRRV